jgi:L-alanine-DL-glutamate epimerase-like enolase superfamily enzyme
MSREQQVPTIVAVEATTVTPRVDPDLVVHGARGTHASSPFALVRIACDDGAIGYGEVSATPLWSGEDGITAAHFARTLLREALVGQPLAPVAALSARLDRTLAANPFTKAGVNMALWDALGRSTGLPVTVLLGGPLRTAVPTKLSLSGEEAAIEAAHAAAVARGFEAFKLKVGFDPAVDARRLAYARRLVGEEAFLGMDANGGWSRGAAARALELTAPSRPAFVEQPLAAEDLDGLRELRGRGLPLLVDESVFSLGDLARVVRADAADAVAIYVGKSGGLERAVAQANLAAAFGLETIIGSNMEGDIGAAAQLHVACAIERLSATIPSDIAGPLYYAERFAAEPVAIDGVLAHLPAGPGLGIVPNAELEATFR